MSTYAFKCIQCTKSMIPQMELKAVLSYDGVVGTKLTSSAGAASAPPLPQLSSLSSPQDTLKFAFYCIYLLWGGELRHTSQHTRGGQKIT